MDFESILEDRIARRKKKTILLIVIFLGICISLYFTIGMINKLENDIKNSSSRFPIEINDSNVNSAKGLTTLISASIELSMINALGSISLSKLYLFAVFQSIILGTLIVNFISMLSIDNDQILLELIKRIKTVEKQLL
jgi:hypothetical protein